MTFSPKDIDKDVEDVGDDELHWRDELTGERPILNPIGNPYHPDGL